MNFPHPQTSFNDNGEADRRTADRARRESEENFRQVLENSRDVIYRLNLKTGSFDYISPAVKDVTGYTVKELMSGGLFFVNSLVHSEDRQIFARYTNRTEPSAGVGNTDYNLEYRFNTKEKGFRWLSENRRVVHDAGEFPTAIIATARDVTEQKEAQAVLHLQKTLLESQSEASVEGILTVSNTGRIIAHNKRFAEMWDIPAAVLDTESDEVALRFVLDKLTDPQEFLETVNRLYNHPEEVSLDDIRLKDGRILERYSAAVKDADNIYYGRFWFYRDITERRRAEEKLRESESRYRLLFENNPLPMWVYDIETLRFLAVNDAAVFRYGYERAEFLAMTIKDIRPPEDVAALLENVSKVAGGMDAAGFWRHRKKSGDFIDVEITSHELIFDGRRAELVLANDVTERRANEQAIHFQAHLLDAVEQAIIATDLAGTVIYWNRFAHKLYGWTPAEAVGRSILELTTPEKKQRRADEIMMRLRRGESWAGEFTVRDKAGATFPAHVCNSPVNDENGKLIGIVGISTDISERRRAEKSLRASEARFRLLCEAAPLGVFLADADGSCLFVNPHLQTVAGCSLEQSLGEGLANSIHPEDRERVTSEWRTAAAAGAECFQQYRFRHADGAVRWVSVRTAPVVSADGEFVSHVGTIEDITERRRVEEALRQAEIKYRSLVELSPVIVYLAEPFPPYSPIYVSPGVEMFGYTAEEWLSRSDMWISLIHEDDRERVLQTTENAISQNLDTDVEYRIVGRDRKIFWVHDKGCFVTDERGAKIGWQGVILDVTETRQLEQQLRQSQKLESVGRLAGGIAHDFNNMLTAINGYSDLTLRRLSFDDPLRSNIEEIKKAGERSAALTHQLLAFSRQQVLQSKVVDLNEIIADTTKMLDRLIGEDVSLRTVLDSKLGCVSGDAGQLTQVIMNLAVNARDAMPKGGSLTIETSNVYLDEEFAARFTPTEPGAYVLLVVADTGVGIESERQENIFEPFYTTKEVGKGTGLGLATVYGIIKQSGGYIWLESEIGQGATFKIYLPRVDSKIEPEQIAAPAESFAEGWETILVVEDEDMVRSLSRQMLEECGYSVVEARGGGEALAIIEKENCAIDLVLTDIVMPQMSGRQLAEKIAEKCPKMRVLFTSGYTDDEIIRHNVIKEDTNFLQKPFTFDALARKVREILDDRD